MVRNSLNLNLYCDVKACQGRRLPHWTCDNAVYHVSARLHDSVPVARLNSWKAEREMIITRAECMGRELSEDEIKRLSFLYSDYVEKYLDKSHGACFLSNNRIAKMVCNSIEFYNHKKYILHSYSVMPNHIHIICEMLTGFKLERVVADLLRYTARQANRALNQSGSFWQREPYDHIIRSEKEYRRQVKYVFENPDKAGLKNWPWKKCYVY